MAARQFVPALALVSALLAGAAPPSTAPIVPERIKEHVRILSSDAFQGRGPTQAGEAKTIPLRAGAVTAASR